MLAIGGTIVAVSIVGSYGVVSSLRSTQEVVVLAKDISQGKTIEASDLTTVKINTDAGLQVVLSTSRDQIIGRTPLKPYDPDREEPILYAAGEYLRFVPITPDEYTAIEAQLAAGTYSYGIFVEGE